MKGDGGVAGEGRVFGVPKLYSWGKCTMSLTNINSDWIYITSSGVLSITHVLYFASWGVMHDLYTIEFNNVSGIHTMQVWLDL